MDSSKETDLAIFNTKWVYSPDDDFSSLVIFEFKRPDFNGSKEIDKQIIEYFQQIMAGRKRTYRGLRIEIDDTTPKFGYIVCETTKEVRENLTKWQGYRRTSNGTLYKYLEETCLYIEILNFDTILKGSTERHQAFFKALNMVT